MYDLVWDFQGRDMLTLNSKRPHLRSSSFDEVGVLGCLIQVAVGLSVGALNRAYIMKLKF